MKNFNFGNGLLSNHSIGVAASTYQITYIPYEQLDPQDELHGFSLEGIEELAASIEEVGLEQCLVVEAKSNGRYGILTGRRRYYAIGIILKRGNDKYKLVPCYVKRLEDIDLPISDEAKREYAIATTNAEQRILTEADKFVLIQKLNLVYDEMKKNGVKPKGRRREFIAESLGISPATVGNYEYIAKNADKKTKEDLQSGTIGLNDAMRIIKGAEITVEEETVNGKPIYIKKAEMVYVPDIDRDFYYLSPDIYKQVLKTVSNIKAMYSRLNKLLAHNIEEGDSSND